MLVTGPRQVRASTPRSTSDTTFGSAGKGASVVPGQTSACGWRRTDRQWAGEAPRVKTVKAVSASGTAVLIVALCWVLMDEDRPGPTRAADLQ